MNAVHEVITAATDCRTTAQATAYWTPTPADRPNLARIAAQYWNSVADPQRGWLLEAMALLGGGSSALELGCQSGPNLRVLRRYFPAMTLVGLDVNAAALAQGRRWFQAAGEPVTLLEGTVPAALDAFFPDELFDVVFSTYTLAYLDPSDITATLQQALRVARRALVLIEPTSDAAHPSDVLTAEDSTYVEWRHDYLALLAGLMNPESAWPGKPTGLRLVWMPKPAHDRLSGVLIAVKEGADGQPVR